MGWALALLLPQIAMMSRKRRPRLGSLLMILAFAAGAALTGCGGHASTSDAGNTPPGTYTAMITATAPGATPITSRLTVVVWQQS
jgi:ABC-type glycerol-3-phosphate transport system substrate-binding protein